MLEDFHAGLSVTPLEALSRYGCLSLSQRISELRDEGYLFAEEWVRTTTGKRIKSFRLVLEPMKESA